VRVNWHAQIAEMFDDLLDVALECGRRKAAAPEAAETRAPPCPAKGRGVKPSGLTVEWPLALRIHLLVRAAFWSRREGAQGGVWPPCQAEVFPVRGCPRAEVDRAVAPSCGQGCTALEPWEGICDAARAPCKGFPQPRLPVG
jgi:hypothetical protein